MSESLTRAWQTLTPAEETVLRVIKGLSEQLKTRGFRRRDLKVKGVSDRRIKEVLKSLADTGYLDCDGRQGPQGYSYTVARDAEEVSLNISLRPVPDSQETPANNGNYTGRGAFARCSPVPDSEHEGEGYPEAGATGRYGPRPIKDALLQEKDPTGRPGGEYDLCIHGYPAGVGCFVCDPNHPYRLSKERAEVMRTLEEAGEPMAPTEVADALDKSTGSVKKLLWSMSKDGQLSASDGRYSPITGNPGNPGNQDVGTVAPPVTVPSDNGNRSNPHVHAGELSLVTTVTEVTGDAADVREVLAAFFGDAPEWFGKQAAACVREVTPERLLNPLASAVATHLFGSHQRWREVLPAVEARLGRMA